MIGVDYTPILGAPRGFHVLCYFGHYMFSPLMACVSTIYLLTLLDPMRKRKRIWSGFLLASAAYFYMLILTLFTGLYWRVDQNNVYHRGIGYWISILFSVLPLVINMALLVTGRRRLERRERLAFWIYSALPTAACIIQLFTTGIHFIIPAIIIAALAMFIFILMEQMDCYNRQESEKNELRIAVMLSQIQPHFLYNALTAIYQTAKGSPETQRAISEFSDYLRVNIDSLKLRVPVPFRVERRHVETYLKLEKLSMEDSLNYTLDCRTEDFRLPALTLQPLVENAVKHGIGRRENGGNIWIQTRETADEWLFSVRDDGVGFNVGELKCDGRSHIGIDNARERLRLMCGGALAISSAPGEGTEVVIRLPKRKKGNDSLD